MKKQISSVLKFLFFFGLGIFLIWLSIKNLSQKDKNEIAGSLKQANYYWLFISIAIGVFSNVIRAIRWKMLLHPLNHYPKTTNTFFAVMVGYLANYALPRLGEVWRCGVLTRYEKIPFAESLGTVIVERLVDVLCFFLVAGIVLLIQFETIIKYLEENLYPQLVEKYGNNTSLISVFAALTLLFLITLFIFRKKIFGLFGTKIQQVFTGFANGLNTITKVKSPFWFLFHSLFIWFCYYVMFQVCFFSLPETAHMHFDAVITAFLLGTMTVMITPGGIGAYPLAIQGVLLVYAVSSNLGYALGWLAWLCQFIANVSFGGLSLILLPILNKDKNGTQP